MRDAYFHITFLRTIHFLHISNRWNKWSDLGDKRYVVSFQTEPSNGISEKDGEQQNH